MTEKFLVLLLCILFTVSSGCTSSPSQNTARLPPVFSNGSVVTEEPWVIIDPVGSQERSATFTITGSSSLPAKSIIQVIIVESGPSAAKIGTMDDCITQRQRCVVYFAKVPANTTGISRWSVTTDDSMDIFTKGTAERFTAITGDISGNYSARLEFRLT